MCLRIDASLRVYDGWVISVGDVGRTVSGATKATPKVGGPVRGARQVLGWTRALRPPPGVADFSVWNPKGALRYLLRPPGGDALRCWLGVSYSSSIFRMRICIIISFMVSFCQNLESVIFAEF